jgi:hypothetical protein
LDDPRWRCHLKKLDKVESVLGFHGFPITAAAAPSFFAVISIDEPTDRSSNLLESQRTVKAAK